MGLGKYDAAFKAAIKAAANSDHYQHRLGSAIVRGSNIISIGYNSAYIHSEHAAINRAWRSNIVGTTLVIVRIRRNGSIGMSKPCGLCMKRLIQAGVKRVVFSNHDGELEAIRLPSRNTNEPSAVLHYHFALPYGDRSRRSGVAA